MCKLIVHADDFGLSEKINEGIIQAHIHGILTSTSIMANGRAFEHAVELCQSTPTLDVGIHLTLVGEQPLLNPGQIPSLVDNTGKFDHHATEFTKRYLLGKIYLPEVRRELEAQIEKVLSFGLSISHLDSHQHLHILPQILNITVDLAKKYNIRAIRFPCENLYVDMLRAQVSPSRILQSLVLKFLCFRGRNANIWRTDHFSGFLFGGNLNKQNLQKIIECLPRHGTCELMCHPGLDDPNTRYNHWGYRWSDELNALIDPDISNLIDHKGIHLTSYRLLID